MTKKKPTPKTIPSVLLITSEEDSDVITISFFDHRQDGSKYLLKTEVGHSLIRTMKEDYGDEWQNAFREARIGNSDLGISIMISPPLDAPLTE